MNEWIRRRQLTDDGNVEITGRDLRERAAAIGIPPEGHQTGARITVFGRSPAVTSKERCSLSAP